MNGKNIIVGVTGGIAAYKSPILIRRLREQGADVRVVMTAGARSFITALTLQAVSGHPVRDTLLDAQAESGMDHIELARWAGEVIIAPASANFIARLAHGMADDLLTTLCLATTAAISVAPAMNQQMWQNPLTRGNMAKIRHHGIRVLGPADGDQACGESGPGRMLDPTCIIEALQLQPSPEKNAREAKTEVSRNEPVSSPANSNYPKPDSSASTKNSNRPEAASESRLTNPEKPAVLITAGPTWEALDPVRGFTNHSSGKMGYAIAEAFADSGYPVTLVSGPTSLCPPENVSYIPVVSASDMYDAVHRHIDDTDIFISVAAVADYRPETNEAQKIKKTQDTLTLTLVKNPDILSSVAGIENAPFTVGFAAETENVSEYARRKLEAKKINMIVANQVGEGIAFGQDDNRISIIGATGTYELGPDSKYHLARQVMTQIQTEYENFNSA